MNTPGNCPHEVSLLDLGAKQKSECDLRTDLPHTMWTNCREAGRCVLCDAPIEEDEEQETEE